MNPKLLDARLAERLGKIWLNTTLHDSERCDPRAGWEAVADYVRKIVKEANKQKENGNESNKVRKSKKNH